MRMYNTWTCLTLALLSGLFSTVSFGDVRTSPNPVQAAQEFCDDVYIGYANQCKEAVVRASARQNPKASLKANLKEVVENCFSMRKDENWRSDDYAGSCANGFLAFRAIQNNPSLKATQFCTFHPATYKLYLQCLVGANLALASSGVSRNSSGEAVCRALATSQQLTVIRPTLLSITSCSQGFDQAKAEAKKIPESAPIPAAPVETPSLASDGSAAAN